MKLVKCKNGHYYDEDKLLNCPQCAALTIGIEVETASGQYQSQLHTVPVSTRGIKIRHHKTVGWLVCLEGELSGESFPIRDTINHIGRDSHMDISLYCEKSVSREKHASIVYRPERNICILQVKGKENLTLVNGTPLKRERILHDRDIITLGDCHLLFVVLCDNRFSWPQNE